MRPVIALEIFVVVAAGPRRDLDSLQIVRRAAEHTVEFVRLVVHQDGGFLAFEQCCVRTLIR
jgi:hypothetical protein